MKWPALLAIIRDELGADAAERIEARAIREMGGVRLSVPTYHRPKRPRQTPNRLVR